MANQFSVDVDELTSVVGKLRGAQQDAFHDANSPLNTAKFHNATASDVQNTAVAGQIKRVASTDGGEGSTSFGSTQYIDAIGVLNQAHCQLQQSIYGQFGATSSSVDTLHTRLHATQQAYAHTDSVLNGSITQVQHQAAS